MTGVQKWACKACGGTHAYADAATCILTHPTPAGGGVFVYDDLTTANKHRQFLWNKGHNTNGLLYAATELAGEVGELCNVVKKLEREARGLVGSRATDEQFEDELGDVIICVFLLASERDVDPMKAAARKFNKTSRKLGFSVEMSED